MSNLNDTKKLCVGPKEMTRRPTRCTTEYKKIKCEYTWTIKDYTTDVIDEGDTVVLKSPIFTASPDTCEWFIKLYHHHQSDSFLVKLWIETNSSDVTENGLYGAEIKFAIIDSSGKESHTMKKKHKLKKDQKWYGGENLIGMRDLVQNKGTLLPQNNLTIFCEVIFTKLTHVVDDFNEELGADSKFKDPGLIDFEKLLDSKEYSDILIHVNGKEYPAHKIILAGRSPVFAAMLKHDMKETQTNRIDIEDNIDDEVFAEALRFIYTGKVQNLETLAFELLPVADKYDLENLKIICGKVLYEKLSVETVVKILVLADMHGMENLKKKCIKFMKDYSMDVISKVDAESWSNLICRPSLMKELLSEFSK